MERAHLDRNELGKQNMRGKSGVMKIYGLVTLYALCYQLQRPIEPFLVDRLVKNDDDAATAYAKLQSFMSIIQTVGSIFFGLLLDRCGVRVGLAVNFFCCALTYAILSQTDSIEMLWLSKIPGLGLAGFLCAQTAVTQVTTEGAERLTALGRLTTAYTIGGTIGPVVGGYLGSEGDYYVGAKCAAFGSLLALAVVAFLPAEMDRCRIDKTNKNDSQRTTLVSVVAILRLCGILLFVKVASGVLNSLARASLPIILKDDFGFSEKGLGTSMSASYLFGGFANGVLLEPLTRVMGGSLATVIRNCLFVMGVLYAVEVLVYTSVGSIVVQELGVPLWTPFAILGVALSMLQFILSTASTTVTSTIVPSNLKGTMLGIEHALFSLARIFGPPAGMYLLKTHGLVGVAGSCACGFFSLLSIFHGAGEAAFGKQKGKDKTV